MNLDELRSVQNRERATDSLQELRDTFYADVAEYVEGLREERDRRAEQADDPFSDPEVSRLTDEIEMAEQVAEAIYERRVGKIVKQASLAAAGMEGDQSGLTDEERALYADLVERIQENKRHVLDVLAGDAEPVSVGGTGESAAGAPEPAGGATGTAAGGAAGAETAPPEPEPGREQSVAANDVMGGDGGGPATDDADATDRAAAEAAAVAGEEAAGGDESGGDAPDAGGDAVAVDRETVRITRDVGEIFGVDERTYTLEADDVVQLPADNAAPLVERDAAERLE